MFGNFFRSKSQYLKFFRLLACEMSGHSKLYSLGTAVAHAPLCAWWWSPRDGIAFPACPWCCYVTQSIPVHCWIHLSTFQLTDKHLSLNISVFWGSSLFWNHCSFLPIRLRCMVFSHSSIFLVFLFVGLSHNLSSFSTI